MPVNYSLKHSILILLGGLACAAGTAFLVNFFLAGPKLGTRYDFLVSRQKPAPVSREILIINTDVIVESGDMFSVLLTLTETGASNLIMTGKIPPSSSPVLATEAEIRRRFFDEYILIGANIRNLFEAIRSGSLSPVQAPGYVERLVELTEQGRDRLLSAIIDRDEDLLRAIAVFGGYLETETKPVLDRDGKLRRVNHLVTELSAEHPVFMSLKNRYAAAQVETTDQGRILWLRGLDGKELDIPLDKDGNIITSQNRGFRGVDIALFREYEEAGRVMRSAMAGAGELGAFSQTLPEQSPLFLGDYALSLREEMLKSQGGEKRDAWISARANYFKSLDNFLNGPAEMILVNGYEEVIADEVSLNEEGLAALVRMRDELRQSFAAMRETYGRLSAVHAKLEEELASSFCIIGPQNDAMYSALLANVLITGSHIKPAYERHILFWSILAALVILLVVFLRQPAVLLICGICLSLLAAAVFGLVFIFYSYWIDPVIVLCSSLAGTLVVFYLKRAGFKHRARCFRAAYGAAVSESVLKDLIRLGKPGLCDVVVSTAAVVAIRDINLLKTEDREKPREAGSAKGQFFSSVKKAVFDCGAVIAGFESDTVLACFGSPLDKSSNPVGKARAFVRELLNNEKNSWCFGIDAGECTFSWSPETGYSVNGQPAVRARVLVSKTARLKSRALVTDFVRESINAGAKETGSRPPMGTLYDNSEPFFEFPR